MSTPDALTVEKQHVARSTTLTSVGVNTLLMSAQIAVGVFAQSQALIADGIHSLADLVSDFVVLEASHHSQVAPDTDHNYGHNRYETVATLLLGALLIVVGLGMLWRAGDRLIHPQGISSVHSSALIVALIVLVSKELLFRYMLRGAQRVQSALLIANAWHARSDAASSLVVALGIFGSMAGWRFLDPVAAGIVGIMVARMGFSFCWDALQDLSDRALDPAETDGLRNLLLTTPGVRDVHELRTRKMGDHAIVDAHILVDSFISVSEGHYIAESARARLRTNAHVLDALIHVDPENDDINGSPAVMPERTMVAEALKAEFGQHGLSFENLNLHYLSSGFDVEVVLPAASDERQLQRLDRLNFDSMKARHGIRDLRFTQQLKPRTPGLEHDYVDGVHAH